MASSGAFTCPGCAADFNVQERLGEEGKPAAAPGDEPLVAGQPPHEEAVSFQCPACGADYATEDRLQEEAQA